MKTEDSKQQSSKHTTVHNKCGGLGFGSARFHLQNLSHSFEGFDCRVQGMGRLEELGLLPALFPFAFSGFRLTHSHSAFSGFRV